MIQAQCSSIKEFLLFMLQILKRALSAARWHFIASLALTALLACSAGEPSGSSRTLTVFAASSLTESFAAVATAFEQANPETSVTLNFAGSQLLRVQLENGARADIFASADQRHMDLAIESGLVSGEDIIFTSNTLVIVVPKADTEEPADSIATSGPASSLPTSEAGSLIRSSADLAREGVKLALAQPEVPAGRYARAVIHRMAEDPRFGPSYAREVLANVVSQEPNVRHVLQKVALGEADAGIVYYSDAQVTTDVSVIPISQEANVVADYTFALLRDSNQTDVAEAFINFVLSPRGQSILGEYGFGPDVPSERQVQGQS